MLDKTIKHFGVVMKKEALGHIPSVSLQPEYRIVHYKSGDEQAWADIELSVGEFECTENALAYFWKEFGTELEEVKRRMLFVENKNGEKIATTTAWMWKLDGKSYSKIHWVAVKPEYQGKGLCKALISEALNQFVHLGHEGEVILFSQTWSYKAINIYYQYGFKPYDDGKHGLSTGSSGVFDCDFYKAWRLIDSKIMDYRYEKRG